MYYDNNTWMSRTADLAPIFINSIMNKMRECSVVVVGVDRRIGNAEFKFRTSRLRSLSHNYLRERYVSFYSICDYGFKSKGRVGFLGEGQLRIQKTSGW